MAPSILPVLYSPLVSKWYRQHQCSPGDFPDPGIEPRSLALQADSLPPESSSDRIETQECLETFTIKMSMLINHQILTFSPLSSSQMHPLFFIFIWNSLISNSLSVLTDYFYRFPTNFSSFRSGFIHIFSMKHPVIKRRS